MATKKASAPAGRPSRLRIIWRKSNQVVLEGVNFNIASRAQWQHQIDLFADALQRDIFDEFAAQRVAGRTLLRNTPEYDKQKAKQGYDTRKGHRTNELQASLAGARLYIVTFSTTRAFVTFVEARLIARVRHAEWYAEAKVQGGKILAFSQRMVKVAGKSLLSWARTQEAQAARMRTADASKTAALLRAGAQGLPAAVAKRVRDLTASFEAGVEIRKRAPFAGRSPFIRPGLGLTQSFLRRIGR